tara:strand:+ start:537 stop:950 length:414 start_codon:yes stop_codon:yes gene_type:complete
MSRKTGLIISWNWSRGYGIVQEQEQTVYEKDTIIMVMDHSMEQFADAVVVSSDGGKVQVKINETNQLKNVDRCCIREQPEGEGNQLFVHNQACAIKEDGAKGFAVAIGKGRVWYDLWERVYFDYGKNNSAINVSHNE